jgi:starvation-inducible outer membrane lipoprotein
VEKIVFLEVFMRTLVLAVLISWFVGPAVAQEKKEAKPASKPGVVVAEATSITATVEAIDYDKRTVTVKGPKGNVVTLKVGPEAKNFNQIKAGDRVRARYYDATAIYVRKPNEPPFAEETSAVQLAPKGAKPRAVAVDTSEMTAVVDDINYKTRTVTLRGPQQKTATLKVDKSVKRFDEVKKGDEIVVRHTQALAIDVKPAK